MSSYINTTARNYRNELDRMQNNNPDVEYTVYTLHTTVYTLYTVNCC